MTQFSPILQTTLPAHPWAEPAMRRMPGIQPLDPRDWLVTDEAFEGQMGLRARLIDEVPEKVLARVDGADEAEQELLQTVLDFLPDMEGYRCDGDQVVRPDGVVVEVDRSNPMAMLGHLVQEDFCILEKRGEEHVLTSALLCFPASWTLAEKIGRPLGAIHIPVAHYDGDMARRVQRLFDAVRPGRPLWRANYLRYEDYALFQPRSETAPRTKPTGLGDYLRSEVQKVSRLPETGAVVFAIHTYLVEMGSLSNQDREMLSAP